MLATSTFIAIVLHELTTRTFLSEANGGKFACWSAKVLESSSPASNKIRVHRWTRRQRACVRCLPPVSFQDAAQTFHCSVSGAGQDFVFDLQGNWRLETLRTELLSCRERQRGDLGASHLSRAASPARTLNSGRESARSKPHKTVLS